ncbi:DUF6719 family protein [Bosea sp. AAP35]|uniref:DUF6719 family protein n=1 Tax=Bosea sp. AAP35 TaxID=1523417 RepID=UPI0032BF287C
MLPPSLQMGGRRVTDFRMLGLAISLALLIGPAAAQQIYSQEPAKGQIRSGQKVLVDNGRCPRGQLLEVSGGTNPGLRGRHGQSTERSRRCVPRT